jgi:anti-anti-sigma factor
LSVTLKRDSELWVVQLAGEIDIRCAAELKQSLLEALAAAAGTTLRIDLGQTTAMDITALQLLWAAAREAEQKRIVFGVAQPVPDTVGATVREAGFEKRLLPGCPPRESVAGTEPCPGP